MQWEGYENQRQKDVKLKKLQKTAKKDKINL